MTHMAQQGYHYGTVHQYMDIEFFSLVHLYLKAVIIELLGRF